MIFPTEYIEKISKAYDLTVDQFKKGIEPFDTLPENFRNSDEFKEFIREISFRETGLNSGKNKKFLSPEKDKKFLDIGSNANLFNHHLYRWPSEYYGVDISPKLINAMKRFISENNIKIGGLFLADASNLPFENNFFDMSALIGVLEYYPLDYIEASLKELNRVLKNNAKAVIDIPNPVHIHVNTMAKLEMYLCRTILINNRNKFEKILKPLFDTIMVDDSSVMITYFLEAVK